MLKFVHWKDNQDEFKCLWLEFEKKHVQSPYLSLSNLEYMRVYSKFLQEDLSFVAVSGDKPVGIVNLFFELKDGVKAFSLAGIYFLPAPLISDSHYFPEIFQYINSLAKEKKVVKCSFAIDPLSYLYTIQKHNFLQEFGFFDCSIANHVISLADFDEDSLLKSMRKGHRQAIEEKDKDFSYSVVDYKQPDHSAHEIYRNLHHLAAGRVTRSLDSFEMQFSKLKADEAAIFFVYYKGKPVSATYFFHKAKTAYYFSAADDPEFVHKKGLYHKAVWQAIKYYKKRGFSFIEIGPQQFGLQVFDHPSEKDLNLSFFKRGFGGINVPLMRGVKYYDYSVLENDLRSFLLLAKQEISK